MPARQARFLSIFLLLLSTGLIAQTPAAPSGDLPTPDALLKELRANQKQVEALTQNYIYIKTSEEHDLDKSGRVKDTDIRQYECRSVAGREVCKLLAKDGIPLNEKDARKEEKELAERMEKAHKRAARAARKAEKEDDVEVELKMSQVLQAIRFFNGRREQVNGRSVVAYDFEPRADFNPKGREQEVAHRLAGSIFVDDGARQIVRMEARFLEGYKIGGGVLGAIKPGTRFMFEQMRVNDEVWLPSRIDADLGYRILFKGANKRMSARYSDYRKFRVESAITATAPIQN